MAKYFTLREMTYSDTAKKYGIDNTPSLGVIEHLNELMNFLDPLREVWGSPITVNSGYRCEYLNTKVGGSPTSVHKRGWAVDLSVKKNKMEEFKQFVKDYLKDKKFDQCLIEKNSKTGAEWVHIGLYSNTRTQRCQMKIMVV